MNQFLLAVSTLSLLAYTGIATAQETARAADLQRDVEIAKAEATALAQELHADLVALVPSVPGWNCQEAERRADATALDEIPIARFNCEHIEQSLSLTLLLDSSTARVLCQKIASDQQGIADGRFKPDLLHFFEGGGWQIVRAFVDLRGCAANAVALMADGNRSEAATAMGPAAIDAFAEGFFGSDPAALAAKASAHVAALNHLLALLDSQSRLLADLIPTLPDATRKVRLPSAAAALGLPLPATLSASPSATATLNVEGCSLYVEISASPVAIHEARTTGLRWATPRGEDGMVNGAFIRRNTDRFVGLERVDGTGIEVLLDDVVLVRVIIPGNHICDSDLEIVSRLFEEIIADNPAELFLP